MAVLIAGLLLPATGQAAEGRWYDGPLRAFDITFDVLVARPSALAVVTAGVVLFVPAAILTAPGGRDPLEEAFERFIEQPGQQLWGRPLGEL